MTMLYCLSDLTVGCDIFQHDGDEATLTALVQADFDSRITGWEPAWFGDCWVKRHRAPDADELNDDGTMTIDGIVCSISPPGTHPGGRAWWLTPVEDVFVPTFDE